MLNDLDYLPVIVACGPYGTQIGFNDMTARVSLPHRPSDLRASGTIGSDLGIIELCPALAKIGMFARQQSHSLISATASAMRSPVAAGSVPLPSAADSQ